MPFNLHDCTTVSGCMLSCWRVELVFAVLSFWGGFMFCAFVRGAHECRRPDDEGR